MPYIIDLYKNLKKSNINLIYTAIGLEDEADSKRKWFIKMNELGLTGYHISLSDEFEEYQPLIAMKKDSINREIWDIPKYIITDENGIKTDTIYSYFWQSDNLKTIVYEKLTN